MVLLSGSDLYLAVECCEVRFLETKQLRSIEVYFALIDSCPHPLDTLSAKKMLVRNHVKSKSKKILTLNS